MKITILLGSVRKNRQTHKTAYYLQNSLKNRGVETSLIDLLEHPLPIFDGDYQEDSQTNSTVQYISKQLDEADAIVLITPEYNGSFSGVLKNALDYFKAEFYRKPVGVTTVSTGRLGGVNASSQLQHVILSLGAYPMPVKWMVSAVNKSFDDTFMPLHEHTEQSLHRFLEELIWFADAILQKKSIQNELVHVD